MEEVGEVQVDLWEILRDLVVCLVQERFMWGSSRFRRELNGQK